MENSFDGVAVDSADAPTTSDLRAELGARDLARHLALFYRSTTTQLEAVGAYLAHGLQSGYRCLYLTDVNTQREIMNALRAVDIDAQRRLDAGDLVIRDAEDVYLDSGFDPARMIETLEDEANASVADGYERLWIAGENSWCFHTELSFDHILDFEADFDAACPDLPVTALCQYDLTTFSETSAAKALWTHQQIIYRNTVCENPFYIPPAEYRATDDVHLNVRLMLEQAHSLTRAQRDIERHEQRLTVVNRVLRHNIRNELNIVQGVLQLLADTADLQDTNRERLATALEHTDAVIAMAEKARHVQETISTSSVAPRNLNAAIEQAVRDVEATHPDADVDLSGERDIKVLADQHLETAIHEALTNGIIHQDRDDPTVSLSVSTAQTDTVQIEVRNRGTIPEPDLTTLDRGEETQLEHASGLGLWLIKWIVENAHGELEFSHGDDERVTIRIELYRVPT